MNSCQKSSISGQPYSSLYFNPLTETETEARHTRSCSDHGRLASKGVDFEDPTNNNKENAVPINGNGNGCSSSLLPNPKHFPKPKSLSTDRILKPSSLQFCMQMNEPERAFGSKLWDPLESSSLNIWDYSDSEAAPASSWPTLPNK